LLAGTMLVAAGYARLGQVIHHIPHTVITGFTAGIAVIIASSQVKDFLGLQLENTPADFLAKWAAYFGTMETINFYALVLGTLSLLLIIVLRIWTPRLPAYLVAVVAATLIVTLLHLPVETIGTRFPDIPRGLPMPKVPAFSFEKIKEIIPSAFTIAFLAGIEALLSAVVADGMTGFKHRSNQELVAQGTANIASALFGGLPATGAIARTATNIKAGARTPVSGILHAAFLLLFMLAGMDLMKFVPMAVLAAILFMVSWSMSERKHFVSILRGSRAECAAMLLTFLLTVLVDLTIAIACGVALAYLIRAVKKEN
jgi:SulP family sulfate permease